MKAKDLEQEVKASENTAATEEQEAAMDMEATSEENVAEAEQCAAEEEKQTEKVQNDETENDEAENDEAVGSQEEKKPFFKKKDKKDKRDEQIAELNDKVIRQMAEFDNYRKRTEKEKAMMFDMGAKNIVEKILPIIDNFERGFAVLSDEEKATPFAAGMDKVYKQMMTNLTEAGLKEIEALNCEFNPDFHNAVMHEENEAFGENTVSEVFQKGYFYKDTVVRCSMVKVAN